MTARTFWMRINDIESPGTTSTIYARQTPPDEPGVWARVEIAEDPGVQRVHILPRSDAA